MRLKVGADNLVERLGLLSRMVPTPLVQVNFGTGYSRAIVAGVRLGLFEALSGAELDAEAAARAIDCDPAGVRALANALTGFGLLKRRRGRYRNARITRRWLLTSSRISLRDAVLFLGWCNDMAAELEEGVRTGRLQRIHDREHPSEFWEAYMRALAAFAKLMGPPMARLVKIPRTARRLLDVGGGHGLYGPILGARCPELECVVVDLPEACAVARSILAEQGLSEGVRHIEGDFRSVEWGSDYDVVLIFNVLHNATAAEAPGLLRRSFEALKPGGMLVVFDAAHEDKPSGPDATAGWNELFFYLISSAQAWPEGRIHQWMVEAGFGSIRARHLLAAPTVLIKGLRPWGA
jgi:predicted O-methyltransferase YrrM